MKRCLLLLGVVAVAALALPTAAVAPPSIGHFITAGDQPTCTDIGTQVRCDGKVAGVGGTAFTIAITAEGAASVACKNPAGHRAPGQDATTGVTVTGSTGSLPEPPNGQYVFSLTTDPPRPLSATPTCPNKKWTPVVTGVTFTSALSLFEDSNRTDQVTVPVQ